jgi:hypothetical protein
LSDEKSGGDGCGCAAAAAVNAVAAKPVNTPPASHFAVEANLDIFSSLACSVPRKKRFA